MGYLDKDGLAYLWQKIKTDLAGKQEIYSTEEQRIGTWIDEKPLYKKTIVGSLSSSAVGTVPTIPFDDDWVVHKTSFWFKSGVGNIWTDSFWYSPTYWLSAYYLNGSFRNDVAARSPGAYFQYGNDTSITAGLPRPIILTIEYTKTTDIAATTLSAQSAATIKLSSSALDLSSIQAAPVTAAAAGVEVDKVEEV